MKIRPPILAIFYLLISLGIHYLINNTRIIYSPYNLLGIIILLIGIFVAGWALRLFKKIDTTHRPFDKPTKLAITGPYHFSRNPMYLGLTLVLLGISFLMGSIVMFIAPIAFFLTINALYIPKEEELLQKIFGKDFLEYKNKVRRWL